MKRAAVFGLRTSITILFLFSLIFFTMDGQAFARVSLSDLQTQINDLQDQINNIPPGSEGPQGIQGPEGPIGPAGDPASFTPPLITHDAPSDLSVFDLPGGTLNVNFTITDESEVTYYAIQQGSNTSMHVVEPALSEVSFTVLMALRDGTNTLLIMASDIEGSISKAEVQVYYTNICGDDICGPGENTYGCAIDCAICGDSICSDNENATSCNEDCNYCGDGICRNDDENANSCNRDCGYCGDNICGVSEDATSCSADCARCGDGICSDSEDANSCGIDCARCGDGICSRSEDPSSCISDCGYCGDDICSRDENLFSCFIDCAP